MRLEHYIEELLYRYNCVMVPEFGAFLTQTKSAYIKEANHTFHPPSKVVSFNEQLQSNDGLLVSYVADAEKTTYEDMLTQIAEVSKEWKNKLNNGERLLLGSIGKLWFNKEGKLQFEPANQENYLTTSFGLSSCVSPIITREQLKEEVVALEEEIPFIITPEKREKNQFRSYLKYAAVVLLGVSVGLSGFKVFKDNKFNSQLAQQTAQKEVSKNIEEATFFDTTPLELPALNLKARVLASTEEAIETPNTMTYYIIAGAFKVKENADKKITALQRKGYNASYIGVNKFGFHVVSFENFTDSNDAVNYLRKIKRTESSDAWLFQQ
ncbi:SPOR domain-containing protein [Cellulophaga baltica]|uniref:HU domain-containing protein n=1 Tax=Cellulophaga TaxID=104264 RepID=UPI001C074C4D|nr:MULTISPECIES: SPOR domain-containing protein [Cellulophaga]MBU2995930.1 SPOR domain-containing protein [Cellulophaga baltica]MDO6767325.1 SPOR domain-containing protein [Cellulophaga sp. 1_MG-2023]